MPKHYTLLLYTDAELLDLLDQFSHERNHTAVANLRAELTARSVTFPVRPRTTPAKAR